MTRVFVPMAMMPYAGDPCLSLLLLIEDAVDRMAPGPDGLSCRWCKGFRAETDAPDVFGHERDCPAAVVYRYVQERKGGR